MKATTRIAVRAAQSGVGWNARSLLLAAMLLVAHRVSAQTPAQPSAPNVNFTASGSGTSFSALAPSGQRLTLASDVPVSVFFRPFDRSLVIGISRASTSGASTVQLTLSGLAPSTTYYLRRDGVAVGSVLSSAQGQIVFSQDISKPHGLVWSSIHSTTYILANGVVSPSTAPVSVSGSTYTLTANLLGSLVIQKDSVTLDGNSLAINGSGQATGVDLSARTGVTVKNLTVKGFSVGVLLSGTINSAIINSTFTNNSGAMVSFDYPSAGGGSCLAPPQAGLSSGTTGSCNAFLGNYIAGTSPFAIFGGFEVDQFVNNVIKVDGGGIATSIVGYGSTLQANQFLSNGTALDLQGAGNTIVGNTFSSNTTTGLYLEASNTNVSSNTFAGNTDGIDIIGKGSGNSCSTGNIIQNNSFASNFNGISDYYGILGICAVSSNDIFRSNRFQGNSGSGIWLNDDNNDNPVIERSTFSSNGIGIKAITGAPAPVVYGNYFVGNSTGAIMNGSQMSSNTFQNNVTGLVGGGTISGDSFISNQNAVVFGGGVLSVSTIALNGMGITGSGQGLITGNFISSNTGAGIALFSAYQMAISSNVVQANGSGIGIQAITGFVAITNNLVSGNTGTGIADNGVAAKTIVGNTVQSNGIGISLAGGGGVGCGVGCVVANNFVASNLGAGLSADQGGFSISTNTFQANGIGISLSSASVLNTIFHNNFIVNSTQAVVSSLINGNDWNLPYPSGGNFWSDFISPDNFSGANQNMRFPDGIVDMPHDLAPNNRDTYPFTSANGWLSENLTAPGTITDLTGIAATSTTITLRWTAPGDHASSGTARNYDFRYSTTPISPTQFLQLAQLPNPPLPVPPGTLSTLTVTGLSAGTTYYFAVESQNELDVFSAVSNIALAATTPIIAPPVITSLSPVNGSTVTTALPTIAVVYFDTGTGGVNISGVRLLLDGVDVTTRSTVTASSATFVPASLLSQGTHTVTASVGDFFSEVTTATSSFFIDSVPPVTTALVDGLPTGSTSLLLISTDTIGFAATDSGTGVTQTLFSFDGASSAVYVSPFHPPVGNHILAYQSVDNAGNVESPKSAALFVTIYDTVAPTIALVPAAGSTVAAATPLIAALYFDDTAVSTPTVRLALDGVDVTNLSVVTLSSVAFVPASGLTQGAHTVTASAADLKGLTTTATAPFFLDSIPPTTTLLVNGLAAGTTSLGIGTGDSIGFVAADSGTGVAQTRYFLDASTTPAVFVSVFSLSVGTHTIAYQSVDKAGNIEPLRTVFASVSDTIPPNPVTDLAAQYGSLLQSSPTVIAPANSDVLLTWSTPADDVGTTGFQVWRSTTSGQLGVFAATVTIAGLDPGVTGFLGGKDYFFDAGSQFVHGTVLFYTVFAFDAAGNVNASTANVQTAGITIDHVPPVVTTALSPSTGSFVTDPLASSVLLTRRLPSSFEATYNLTNVTDDGASGGILSVQLGVTKPLGVTGLSGSTQTVSLSPATTSYVVNSSSPYLLSAVGGQNRGGCLRFIATDKAGNSAAIGRCIEWDGDAPMPGIIIKPNPATAAGQIVTFFFRANDPMFAAPQVTVRQNGLVAGTTVAMIPSSAYPYTQFSGTYSVVGGYDGSAIVVASATDIVGNSSLRNIYAWKVVTGNPIYNAFVSRGDPDSWNPAAVATTIGVSVAATVDLQLQISSQSANGSLTPILTSTFTNQIAGSAPSFVWDGTVGGVPQPDNPYVYTWTAFVPDGTFTSTTGVALSGNINMVRSASLSLTGVQTYPAYARVSLSPAVNPMAQSAALSSGTIVVGAIYDLQPSGVVFSPPAQLTICAPPGMTLPAGTTLDTYNPATSSWAQVTPYTQAGNCITASLAHLSLYALIAPAPKPVDVLPPRTQLIVGDPEFGQVPILISSHTPLSFVAVDDKLKIGDAQGTVARTLFSVDNSPFARFVSPFAIPAEGPHAIRYFSVDAAGNTEQIHYSTVAVDATPPVSALTVSSPGYAGYVSSATLFSLSAVDPIVNGVASGVASTRYRVNGGAFATSPLAFRLTGPDGAYQVDYQSQDNVSNLEVLRSTTVFLDQTPPVTTPQIGAPNYVASDGTQYVTPATPLTFTAVDPSSGAVASGVNHIEFALDGSSFAVYAATLTFAEGRHIILYRAVDNVGNVEATKTLSLQSDAMSPITAFKASGAYFAASALEGTRLYAPLSFRYSLPATDPVVNNVASGLAFTRYRTGQLTNYASGAPTYAPGGFATSVSTFSLTEGIRRVDFQSQDNVTNLELLKSATVFVDATPPVTALTVGAPQYAAGGMLYVSTVTPFTLASQDPAVQEVASGVFGIFFHLDANVFASYSSTFTIPVPDGVRTASFYAADNVGNLETVKTSTVALDATPPQTSLAILGGHQFPGPDAATFYASADTRFALPAVDPAINGVASGVTWTRWQDNGGTFQAYLSTLSFAEGAHALGYQSQDNVANLEVLRSTNAWIDATPPVTTVAIGSPTYSAPDGTIYVTPATPISFAATDPNLPTGQPGSGVNRIEVALDGGAYAPYAAALKLPEGRHTILYRAVDNVANVEASHALAVQSDATPPVSALVIGSPQYQLPNVLLVSSRTPFGVSAVDPISNNVASGLKDSWYNVNDVAPSTGAFQQYVSSFTLSGVDVNKAIQFYSRDNVLNTEVVKSSTVLLDSTPPEISLLSPAACDSGICRVIKGRFPVLGTARDLHFGNYVLDFAPGQNATTGYALISSGTVAVNSSALGTWDASALAGWQTLRLTATDLVANVSVLTINVFVGDPATLMLLGNHESFDMPTGVAVGVDGRIYVADRDNDRIAVFTSTGGLSAVFGGRHDDHQDDDKVSTSTLRLHEPAGVAVDAASNIYVADTGHQRVLKLSPSGQVLLDLGRRKIERDDGGVKTEFASGKAPGEFRHPLGVAVDAAGSIYVADTGNSRVQVFTSTGGFSLQFALPALPAVPTDDDHEAGEKDDDAPALGRPAGIALDAAGNIYLADLIGRRALRYDPSGRLTLTIPIPGDKPGQAGRPFGIAVSTSGNCLLVSDMQFAHVLKFDMNGAQNLIFGVRAHGDDDHDKPKPAGVALRKPAGLALDAFGNLYVADRNAEKIEKFGLPTDQPMLVVPPPGPGDDDTARDVVSREDGGKVERKDKAAVAIPAQALSDDLKVSVSTPTADVAAAGAKTAADADLKTASPPVDFGPEGTKFQAAVTLTLPYSPDLLAQQNGDESSLKVHYWNKDKGQWEELATQVDEQDHTVTAKTTHFSLYQVFATSSSAVKPLAVADPTFTFHDGYAFPNPVRGTSAVTLRIQPGLADSVEVHVYDLSGRKVHSSSDFAQNILDDGNGKGSQYTYDHIWNVSGVGSGVYMYVITAKKAGMSDIHQSGKIGLVK